MLYHMLSRQKGVAALYVQTALSWLDGDADQIDMLMSCCPGMTSTCSQGVRGVPETVSHTFSMEEHIAAAFDDDLAPPTTGPKGKRKAHLQYSAHYDSNRKMHTRAGVHTTKATHAMRGSGAREAIAAGYAQDLLPSLAAISTADVDRVHMLQGQA